MGDRSPIDPDRRWRSAELVRIATTWQRKKLGQSSAYVSPPMPAPDVIRRNWRQLLLRDLTEAERQLAAEACDEISRRAHAENPRAAARAEAMTRRAIPGKLLSPAEINEQLGAPVAPEIPPP